MTTTSGPAWRVRVDDVDGYSHGAGVAIDGRHVLTCAHVVVSARGRVEDADVLVSLPAVEPRRQLTASVMKDGWFPSAGSGQGDLAVLELAAPADVSPPLLRRCGPAGGRIVSVFGYPARRPDGVWASGRLVGPSGPSGEWMQVSGLSTEGSRNRTAFSGSGVVDMADGAVIGMMIAQRDLPGDAFVMPTETIARYWPPLINIISDEQRPTRRDEAHTTGAIANLVDALLNLPSMTDGGTRRELLYLLPPEISAAIPRNSLPRIEILQIVRTCLNYPGGLTSLLSAIRLLEADTPATQEVAQRIGELQSRAK